MIFFHPLPQTSRCVATQFDAGIARLNSLCADAVCITLICPILYCFINITLRHTPGDTNSYILTLKSHNVCVKTHNYKAAIISRQQLLSVHERNFGQNFRLCAGAVIWLPITGILCLFKGAPRFITRLTNVRSGAKGSRSLCRHLESESRIR